MNVNQIFFRKTNKSNAKVNDRIVNLEDFFEFGVNKPINRLAYTEEDLKYKIKVIKKMQELGMKITLDKARKYLWNYYNGK